MTPWTLAYQAVTSMGFSRQEYWSGLPFPSPGSLPDPEIEPVSPALQTDPLPSEPQGSPEKCMALLILSTSVNSQVSKISLCLLQEPQSWPSAEDDVCKCREGLLVG